MRIGCAWWHVHLFRRPCVVALKWVQSWTASFMSTGDHNEWMCQQAPRCFCCSFIGQKQLDCRLVWCASGPYCTFHQCAVHSQPVSRMHAGRHLNLRRALSYSFAGQIKPAQLRALHRACTDLNSSAWSTLHTRCTGDCWTCDRGLTTFPIGCLGCEPYKNKSIQNRSRWRRENSVDIKTFQIANCFSARLNTSESKNCRTIPCKTRL
jgi:hypothetical protein